MPYFERKTWQETAGARTRKVPPKRDQEVSVKELAQSILRAETERQHSQNAPFRCKKPVSDSNTGIIGVSVSADNTGGPLSLNLVQKDLRCISGQIIPAQFVTLTPDVLTILPGESASFEVQLRVPNEATPGLYAGRITGHGTESLSFIVEFEVIAGSKN
jgi:hypothetical protein